MMNTLKINALLADASTKSYVNADIATELGLQGKLEEITEYIEWAGRDM